MLKMRQAELLQDSASPVGGNADGDITVIEFFDYNCGYCKKAAPTVTSLIARDAGVRVIYKEFPILGPQSIIAARAALAAAKQGKYSEFHQQMMARDQADDASIKRVADQLGLDHGVLLKDMETPEITEAIDRNYRLAADLGIEGTPAFIVGERMMPGAVGLESLAAIVTAERNKRLASK